MSTGSHRERVTTSGLGGTTVGVGKGEVATGCGVGTGESDMVAVPSDAVHPVRRRMRRVAA
jgi:hypothetical protein